MIIPPFCLHDILFSRHSAVSLSLSLRSNSATAIITHSCGLPKHIPWLKIMLEHKRRQQQATLHGSFIVYFKQRIIGLENNISDCGYCILYVQTS